MIMPPPGMFPAKRPTKAELALAALQQRGRIFMDALARFQPKKKKGRK